MAQWQAQSGVPNVDHYGIERLDGQTIHGAGASSLLRTTDNGVSWDTTTVTVFGVVFPCVLYDVHFFSAQEGVATGFLSLGSQYVILRTTDAGLNWGTVYTSNTGGLVRWLQDLEFGSATEGFTVGSDNRLLRTTNGGQTWNQLNPPSGSHLYDFEYGNGNVRHIAGDGRILRSTDGGTNWSAQYFSGYDLRALHFPSAQRGYAAGQDGVFLRTDNGGLNWSPMDVPITDDITDLYFVSDEEGYATAGTRIWHTTSGGAYWEWFACGKEMNAVAFSNGEGIAVGMDGALFRSSNGTTGYHPVPLFEMGPTTFCEDSLVVLTNLSEPALSSTWLHNGTPFATTTDASLVIDEPAQTDTISLVVDNGANSDTLSVLISIAPSLNLDVAAVLVQDTLCNGSSTQVQVPASVFGISYRLRRGLTNIGSAQNGNGNTLTFNTGAINGNDTLNILGTRVVAGCGTGRDSTYLVIHSATPLTNLPITVVDPVLCIDDSTAIILGNSEIGVTYRLKIGTQNIGAPEIGTGGSLTFSTGPLEFSTTFTVFATHPFGCTATMTTSALVTVERPEPYFTLSSLNPEAGATVTVTNTSGPAVGYAWDFGATSTPSSSTAIDPGSVVFNEPGTVEVSLTITSPSGCTNTASLNTHVISPVEPATCYGAQGYHIGGSGGHLAGLRHGLDGDVFLVMDNGSSEDLRFYSGHGDTLVELLDNGFDLFSESYQVVKFAASGVPQWLVRVRHGSVWAGSGDVAVDEDGNIYMVFFHGEHHDSLSIYSSDGRKEVTYMPDWDGSTFQSAVVVSWDEHGLYRWHNSFLEPYWLDHLRLALDNNGGVYAMGKHKLVKFDRTTGQQVWTVPYSDHDPYNEYMDMCVAPDGTVHVVRTFDLTHDRYDASGAFIGQEILAETIDVPGSEPGTIVATGIASDADGSIYLTGNFHGRCIVGSDTLDDLAPYIFLTDDLFLTKLTTGGNVAWTREFDLDGPDGYYDDGGISVGDGHVLLLGACDLVDLSTEGSPPLSVDVTSHVILHTDTAGGTPRMVFYPSAGAGYNGYFGGTSLWDNAITHDPASGGIAADVDFGNAFDLGGQTIEPYPQQYAGNVFVGLGEIGCFVPTLPSPSATPVSWFTADLPACAGQPVQFTDASLNGAAGWSWNFTGGTPATSEVSSPTVTFNAPGTHTVTLTASNGNGAGTTFSADITVDVCTGVPNSQQEPLIVQPCVANDRILITSSALAGAIYRIVDMQGRVLLSGKLSPRTEVGVQALATGEYLVVADGSTKPARFVVVR